MQDVVKKGTGGWKKVVKAFGNNILLENGEIDRARLGHIVFTDPAKRQLLNRYGLQIALQLETVPIQLGLKDLISI